MSNPSTSLPQPVVRTPPAAVAPLPSVSSESLLNGRREILIQHGDRLYRLRHTSNDKLILTK